MAFQNVTQVTESLDFCTARFGGGEPTFAGASCNDEDAPKADGPFDRQRRSKIAPMCRGAGAPETVPTAAYLSARCSHGSRSSGNICLVGRNNSA